MPSRSLRSCVRFVAPLAVLGAFAAATAATSPYPVTNPDSCNLRAPYAVVHEFAVGAPGFYEGFHIAVCEAVPAFQFSGIPDDKIGAVSVFNGAVVMVTERPENDGSFPGRLVASTAEVRDLAPFGLDAKASSLWFLPPGTKVGDSGMYAVNYDRAGRKLNGAELIKTLAGAGLIATPQTR